MFRWNCITPVANSELGLKSCILRSWDPGFALKSLLGHSEKMNGLKDQKQTQKLVNAWCSPGSVFFKCCYVLSEKKKIKIIALDGPSSCGCSMCHTVEIKDQRINRVCCVTKLKAFLSFDVCTPRKTYCTNETQLYVLGHIYACKECVAQEVCCQEA